MPQSEFAGTDQQQQSEGAVNSQQKHLDLASTTEQQQDSNSADTVQLQQSDDSDVEVQQEELDATAVQTGAAEADQDSTDHTTGDNEHTADADDAESGPDSDDKGGAVEAATAQAGPNGMEDGHESAADVAADLAQPRRASDMYRPEEAGLDAVPAVSSAAGEEAQEAWSNERQGRETGQMSNDERTSDAQTEPTLLTDSSQTAGAGENEVADQEAEDAVRSNDR